MIFLSFLALLTFGGIFGYDAITSDGVIVFYETGLRDQALEIIDVFERVRESVVKDMENDPGTIVIVLKNMGTYTNGFADPVLKQITVLTWPEPDVWLNFNDWYETVITHEFTHIAHLTNERGVPGSFTHFTGFPLLNPQFRSPFVEATTVYEESKRGSGRLNNPFLSVGMVGSFSRGWRYSLGELAVPSKGYFLSGVAHYIIPANFYSFLVREYGENRIKKFFDEYSDDIFGLGLESDFKKVFGSDLNASYQDWLDSFEFAEFKANPLFFRKNVAVMDIASDGENVYFTALEYGSKMLMGGNVGFVAKLKGVGFYEKLFDFSNLPVDIKVDSGRIYCLENIPLKRDLYTRRIVEFRRGNFSTIAQGDISAFNVSRGRVYWAEYDVSSSKSKIFEDGSEIFDIDGFIREMAVSDTGKLALLVSGGGTSSKIIIWDGERLSSLDDARFKYSIFWKDENLYFLMFDDGFADLYHTDGKEIYRDTEGFILGGAVGAGSVVYGTAFSKDSPSIGLVSFRVDHSEMIEPKTPQKTFRTIDVSVEDVDADKLFFSDLLNPDFRLPVILWDGTDVSIGLVLGESSYDYSIVYAIAPMLLLGNRTRLGLYGVAFFDLGDVNLNVEISSLNGFFGLDDFISVSAEGDLWKEKFNPLSSGKAGWFASYRSDGRAEMGLNLKFRSGNADHSFRFGVRMNGGTLSGGYIDSEVSYTWNGFKIDINGELDTEDGLNGSGGLDLTFPMFDLDLGTLDPYFHLGWVYGGLEMGFDDGMIFKGFLSFDTAQFLTYSRAFVRLGFEYSSGTVSPYFRVGSSP